MEAPTSALAVVEKATKPKRNQKRVAVVVPEGEDPDTYVPSEFIGSPIAPNKFCRRWRPKVGKYCRNNAGARTDHPGEGRCYRHHGPQPHAVRPAKERHLRYNDLGHKRLGELVQRFAMDPDPLNLLGELDVARALLFDFIERHGEFTEQLSDWHASFRLVKNPIDPELEESYRAIVEEYAIMVAERGDPSDREQTNVARAKRYLDALAQPVDRGRPRRVTDILDATKAIDSITKLVTKLDDRNSISEPELNRIFGAMSRVVDIIVPDQEQKRLIREGWMRAVTR